MSTSNLSHWLKLLLVGVFVCTSTLYAMPKGKPFVELEGQIVEVKNSVASIETQVNELLVSANILEGRVTNLETNMVTINSAIQVVKDENAIILEQMSSVLIEATMNNNEIQVAFTKITELTAQIQALANSSGTNNEIILELQAQINIQQSYISANSEGYQELLDKIENNYMLIEGLHERAVLVENAISLKQSVINAECSEGQALTKINPDGSYECSLHTQGVESSLGLISTVVTRGIEVGGVHIDTVTSFEIIGWREIWGVCSTGGLFPHDYSCVVGSQPIMDYVTREVETPITSATTSVTCPQDTIWTYNSGYVLPEGVSITAMTLKRNNDLQSWNYELSLPADGIVRFATFSAQCISVTQ